MERAGEARGDCAETGWRVAENREQTWQRGMPAVPAQAQPGALCSQWPPPAFLRDPPAPMCAQNSDLKAARAIHSLFGCHKNHYKNFTKEPEGTIALPSRLSP